LTDVLYPASAESQDSQNRTARSRQKEEESQNRTARTGQLEQDSQKPEQDSKSKRARAGKL
jgi:hypothetical protein